MNDAQRIISVKSLGSISAVILASIAFVMELVLVPLSLTAIQAELSLTLIEISWFFNIYAIAVAISVLLGGALGCFFDRRYVFLFGVLLFSIGTIIIPLNTDLSTLLLGRAIQGIGGGIFSPFVPVLLARSFPENQGRILMIWGGLAGVVATLSPLVAGQLEGPYGWRICTWSIAATSVLALLLYFVCRPRVQPRLKRVPQRTRNSAVARLPWTVLAYTFLTYGCFTFFIFYYPLKLANSDVGTGAVFATVWGAFSVLSFGISAKMNPLTLRLVLIAAPILLAVGFTIAVTGPAGSAGILMAAVLIGAGLACSNAPSTDLLLRLTPRELHTMASSLDITFARLGGFIAVILLSGLGPPWAAAAVVACSMLALITCRRSVLSGSLGGAEQTAPQVNKMSDHVQLD